MKRIIVCVAFLLVGHGVASAQEEAVVIDGICVRVNQDVITLSAYRRAQRDLRSDLAQQYKGKNQQQLEAEYERVSKDLLQNLIDTQLLVQKADELGINVEAQINEFLINMAKQNNVPASKIDEMLQQMGFETDQARQMLRTRFLRQAVIGREVYRKIAQNIFDEDVEAYYQQHLGDYTEPAGVKLSELLINFNGRTKQEAKALAWQLITQARAGADFTELAKKHSNGPSASNGGELGWFNLGPKPELGESQRKAIEGKKAGDVTDPVELSDGIRIFHIDDRREKKANPLTPELRREITMRLTQDRMDPAIKEYIERLRQDAYVEVIGYCKTELGDLAADGTNATTSDKKKASGNGSSASQPLRR